MPSIINPNIKYNFFIAWEYRFKRMSRDLEDHSLISRGGQTGINRRKTGIKGRITKLMASWLVSLWQICINYMFIEAKYRSLEAAVPCSQHCLNDMLSNECGV